MNSVTNGCKKYILACTGASGVIYFIRLLKELAKLEAKLHLIVSKAGKQVLNHELQYKDESLKVFLKKKYPDIKINSEIFEHDENDFFTPPASGSFIHNGMVIVPSSMKTTGAIASGISDSLILRAADTALKERRKLIIVPREAPYNRIHLENMIRLNDAGAVILPASPSFYNHPENIDQLTDSIIGRIIDHLGISHNIFKGWKSL
ncbi:MAG: aromatic acid decarboxylase [Deltaproteobacteria bacterium]|nr:MAG: aromatic acid decarboxylase [Deltaproteobacteria bacterium]